MWSVADARGKCEKLSGHHTLCLGLLPFLPPFLSSLSVSLSFCLSLFLSVCLFPCLSVCLSVCLFVLSLSLSLSLSLTPTSPPSVSLSVCLCFCLCLSLSVRLPPPPPPPPPHLFLTCWHSNCIFMVDPPIFLMDVSLPRALQTHLLTSVLIGHVCSRPNRDCAFVVSYLRAYEACGIGRPSYSLFFFLSVFLSLPSSLDLFLCFCLVLYLVLFLRQFALSVCVFLSLSLFVSTSLPALVLPPFPPLPHPRPSFSVATGFFSGSSHTGDLIIGTPVATKPCAWHYRVSAGTGRLGVSIL